MGISVYSDGSCKEPGDIGGWAFVVIENDEVIYEDSGTKKVTTSQEMEVMAVKKALQYFCNKNRQRIKFYSDSMYCVKGASSWIFNWEKNNWKNSSKKTVAHVDLWKRIILCVKQQDYSFRHVKAHKGNKWNEYVDDISREVWKKKLKIK